MTNFIIDQYELLYDLYSEDRNLIPKGNLIEIGFEDLEAKPIESLQRVYRSFGWAARFNAMKPAFAEYCKTLEDFKKNDHVPLDPVAVEYIQKAWAKSFSDFGYNPKQVPWTGKEREVERQEAGGKQQATSVRKRK